MSLLGRRFGKLQVYAGAPRNSAGRMQFICRCDCGKDELVAQHDLLRGRLPACICTKQKPAKEVMQ